MKTHIIHPIQPLYNNSSKVLILGSFPSVKSREQGFFYGHPQNRFWKVISAVMGEVCPQTIEEKTDFALRNHIALWDTIASCDITGSSDSSIENVIANDLTPILESGQIQCIYCNGSTSYQLFLKYILPALGEYGHLKNAVCLPSTSPANAAWSLESLTNAWMRIKTGMNLQLPESKGVYLLNDYAKDWFGKKLYRLSLDGGFTCPNRDGLIDKRGCIFCDGGSGDFAGFADRTGSDEKNVVDGARNDIALQLAEQKKRLAAKLPKQKPVGYIAYFQSFTGTYAPVSVLREKYEAAIQDPEICVLSIATRPDCLSKEVLDLLSEMNAKIPVWIELGMQTANSKSAKYIRRGYDLKVYNQAVTNLQKIGITQIITHVILGLPGEKKRDMENSVKHAIKTGSNGIKLQLLHVIKNTDLAKDYEAGKFEVLSMEEYLELVEELTDLLPPDVVVHRLTGDGNKKTLIAPMWSTDKKRVINEMRARNITH